MAAIFWSPPPSRPSVRYAASLSSRPCPVPLLRRVWTSLSCIKYERVFLFLRGAARRGAAHYFLLPFRFRNYTRFVDVTRYSPPYRFTFELHATKEEASGGEGRGVYLAKDALPSIYRVSRYSLQKRNT